MLETVAKRVFFSVLLICGLLLAWTTRAVGDGVQASSRPLVVTAVVDDVIHPITAEYIVSALEQAERQRADVFLLQLSTPGGLDESMRDIIQAFLNSPVPICVFVGPSGSRAASAGFLIAMAADIVAMAPGTNMGAASPVAVGGEMGDTMERKVMQDAIAFVRSVAERQGRPVEEAAEAVSDGRSFAASEAIELGLADFLADDTAEVLELLEGREVASPDGESASLLLSGAEVVTTEMTLRQRVLAVLAHPQVAYILMLLGLAGLYFEISTPGAILPGVVGAISLVLALLAFQVLPINYAGLALIFLAIIFFIIEVKVISYGMLTVAGLVSFVLGSLMLIPGPIPELQLQLGFILPAALALGGLAAFLLWLVVGAHRGKVHTGAAGLIDEIGEATTDLAPGQPGTVFVHGEIWRARTDVPVKRGEAVEVLGIERGMVVRVRPSSREKGS